MARLHLSVGACLQAIACPGGAQKIAHRVGSYKHPHSRLLCLCICGSPPRGRWRGFISLWELACKRLPALALREKSPTGVGSYKHPTDDCFVFVFVGAHPVGDGAASSLCGSLPASDCPPWRCTKNRPQGGLLQTSPRSRWPLLPLREPTPWAIGLPWDFVLLEGLVQNVRIDHGSEWI